MYKYLVDQYKSEWIEYGSINNLKFPLAKYIWKKLKKIYQDELTFQLKENRKKLTEIYLQFESTINIKQNIIQSTSLPNNEILPQSQDNQKDTIQIHSQVFIYFFREKDLINLFVLVNRRTSNPVINLY